MSDSAAAAGGGVDLQLINVTKRFGDFTAVDDLTLTIPQGSFFALLGPSGCGKTTTLRMVAGLEEPTDGTIKLGSEDITWAKPYRRPVNTVFQSYALFPHLDIFENVAFGLRRRGQKDIKKQVDDILELVELGGLARRKPPQLSGGQQQRVALARALINRPKVLLLDEPLGALDLKLRRQMQLELKRIQLEVGITFVHVTHDQEEAMTMADTIAVMNVGRVEQMGAPTDLYENPSTTFAANFLGQSNFFNGRVMQRGTDAQVQVGDRTLRMDGSRIHSAGDDVHLGVRPEKLRIAFGADAEMPTGFNRLEGVVTDASFIGVSTQYLVRMPWGQEVIVFEQNTNRDSRVDNGAPVTIAWDPLHAFALDASQDVAAGADLDDEAAPAAVAQ
ncbi:MAG: ABC transporter ATP-binding protein [Actinomycetes bacterium]